ncbi:MAG TPA: sigma-70 family RNA polymerase sigma factor [Flavisolibacter sp.]|jgi:RNA polymerase sigma-70 factor (ECF subfamily)
MSLTTTLSGATEPLQVSILPQEENSLAFQDLYKRYWEPLLNFASHYIDDKETCEEIVQDFFVRIYIRGLNIKIKHTLSSYLCVALRNRIFNHFRNKAVYKKHLTNAARKIPTEQNNIEQFIYMKELEQSVHASLQRMPPRYREVYVLRQDQLTVKQIAQTLNRPLDTVEKQLRKAKHLLTEDLKTEKRLVAKCSEFSAA